MLLAETAAPAAGTATEAGTGVVIPLAEAAAPVAEAVIPLAKAEVTETWKKSMVEAAAPAAGTGASGRRSGCSCC